MFKHLHKTAWSGLHLGVELFTQIHVDIEIFELIAVVQSALVRRIDLVFVNVYDGLLLRLGLCLRKDQVHHILNVNTSIRVLSFQFFSQTYGNIDFPFLAEIYHPILCHPNILDLLTSPIAILICRILLVLLLCCITFDNLHLLQTDSRFGWLRCSCHRVVYLTLVDTDALVLVESVVVLIQKFTLLVCFYLEEVAILCQYYILFYLFNAYLQIDQELDDFELLGLILVVVECHHFIIVRLYAMQIVVEYLHVSCVLHSSPSSLNLINSSAASTDRHC